MSDVTESIIQEMLTKSLFEAGGDYKGVLVGARVEIARQIRERTEELMLSPEAVQFDDERFALAIKSLTRIFPDGRVIEPTPEVQTVLIKQQRSDGRLRVEMGRRAKAQLEAEGVVFPREWDDVKAIATHLAAIRPAMEAELRQQFANARAAIIKEHFGEGS